MGLISFLNPFGDGLSLFFFILLTSLFFITLITVWLNAKPENWEYNWLAEDGDNNLGSEHGSVHELSEAIATKSEKFASVAPSMLLIIGLLGTFVGLGIALNKASEVLASADTMSNMDNAMTQLMGLMEGLGAKFKTSTYGLFYFIVLNLVFQLLKNYDNERLTWVINKVKEEDDLNKSQAIQAKEQKHQELLQGLSHVANAIQIGNQSFATHIQALQETQTQTYQEFLTTFKEVHNAQIQALDNHTQAITLTQKEQLSTLQSLERKSVSQHDQLLQFLQSVFATYQTLQSTSEAFKTSLLTTLKEEFGKNSEILQNSSKNNITELQKIATYNQQTQKSMQDFVEQTVSSMSSIGTSADKMAESAKEVGNSAQGLNEVVQNLKSELESVMQMIKSDLGETITNMGNNFETNMAKMSENMSEATQGISTAVGNLSTNVEQTMTTVSETISKSMELQEASSREFTVTSETLNVNINEMTGLVNQLKGDIVGSLKETAESSRRVHTLNTRYERYSDTFEAMQEHNKQLLAQLEKLVIDVEHANQQGKQNHECNQTLIQGLTQYFNQNKTYDLVDNINTKLERMEYALQQPISELYKLNEKHKELLNLLQAIKELKEQEKHHHTNDGE